MLQNSLDRLFTGIAAGLREQVLPALEDRHARAQVQAAIELLGNLSTRVSWSPAYLSATVGRARETLETLTDLLGDRLPATVADALATPMPTDPDGLLASRGTHLQALADAQEWLLAPGRTSEAAVEEARRVVGRFLAWHLEEEFDRLRTRSFGRA